MSTNEKRISANFIWGGYQVYDNEAGESIGPIYDTEEECVAEIMKLNPRIEDFMVGENKYKRYFVKK